MSGDQYRAIPLYLWSREVKFHYISGTISLFQNGYLNHAAPTIMLQHNSAVLEYSPILFETWKIPYGLLLLGLPSSQACIYKVHFKQYNYKVCLLFLPLYPLVESIMCLLVIVNHNHSPASVLITLL